MGRPKRIVDKRTGRGSWEYRFTDPYTGRQTTKRFHFSEEREAQRAFLKYLEQREKLKLGIEDMAAWEMPFKELVMRFLREAPISSDHRRDVLRSMLLANKLGIIRARDLCNIPKLTAKCVKLAREESDTFVRDRVQHALKQLTRWAAKGILPRNPLAEWDLIPRTSEVNRKRALKPNEMAAIIEATGELDEVYGRQYPLAVAFTTLLVVGNRPGVVFNAKVADFDGERIHLPPGVGNKRNGAAFVSPELAEELRGYLASRGAAAGDPLLVSPRGESLHRVNVGQDFLEAAYLAFTKLNWPEGVDDVEPIEVSTLLFKGRARGFDGAPPRDPKKIELRMAHVEAIEHVARKIEPIVSRLMDRVTLYSLKHTHLTWARRLVNHDSVRLQMGRAARDVDERHYLDLALVDARESAEAVWDLLIGRVTLDGRSRERARLVAAAGGAPEVVVKSVVSSPKGRFDTGKAKRKSPQVHDLRADRRGAGDGTRTHDIDLGKVALYH